MRCCGFLVLFFAVAFFATAQSVRFRPLPGFDSLTNLIPVGKFGCHTFMLQRTESDSLRLLLLDDSLKLKVDYHWADVTPAHPLLSQGLVGMGETAAFFSQYGNSTGLYLTIARWDSNGILEHLPPVSLGDWNPRQSARLNMFDVMHDEAGGYHLFYKCRTYPGSDSITFKGRLFNREWQPVKELSFKIAINPEEQIFHNVLVDTRGNIYVLVTDNAFNFRLSTHLDFYTCLRGETGVRKRNILIKDYKLRDMELSEDTTLKTVRLQGIAMQKNSRDVGGVVIAQLAPEGGGLLSTKYVAFDAGFRKVMKRRLIGVRSEAVLNNIRVIEYGKEAGAATVTALLTATPQYYGIRSNGYSTYGLDRTVTAMAADRSWIETGLLNRDYMPGRNLMPPGFEFIGQSRFMPRSSGTTTLAAGLLTLRLEATGQLRYQQWQVFHRNLRHFDNTVLSMQKENVTNVVLYVQKNSRSTLMSYQFTDAAEPVKAEVVLPKGMLLELSAAIRTSSGRYLVPYTDTKMGSGVGLLEW